MKITFATATSAIALWTVYAISASALAVPHMDKRIIGGSSLPGNTAPYIVHLTFTEGEQTYVCGGTVISPRHIVTAAHCVFSPSNSLYSVIGTNIGFGDDSISKQTILNPIKITAHPGYVPATTGQHGVNDIAIIEVAGFGAWVDVIPISIYNGAIPAGQQLTALGWGSTVSNNDPNSQPDVLKAANVWVGDVEGCKNFAPEYTSSDGPLICTLNKYDPGNSTCKGDSGTGVIIVVNGKSYIAGLVSEGGRSNDPTCGTADGYSLFTHVAAQLDFISDVTGIASSYYTNA
ncbi:hypothetical protein GGI24_005152 [Coemansia furcata]|nr:hypothetical protein GGI24_005152 [Coemansia furcata]